MKQETFDKLYTAAREIFRVNPKAHFVIKCSGEPYPGLEPRNQLLIKLAGCKVGSVKGYNAAVQAGLVFA